MPLKKDLVDAVVAKKYCVLKTWLEVYKHSMLCIGYFGFSTFHYAVNLLQLSDG
jgi:hypothetical protein